MGSSSGALAWTHLITAVGRIVDGAPTASAGVVTPAHREAVRSLSALRAAPPLPHAAWKKLVLESKAPQAAAELWVRALQRYPGSPTLHLATTVLEALLDHAHQQRATAQGTRLAASTLQQLQQAGVPQHLPALMADAAEGRAAIRADDPAAAAALHSGGSTAAGSSRSAAGAQPSGSSCNAGGPDLSRDCTTAALNIFCILANLWQGADWAAACLQAAPAAVQLILTVFEANDRYMQSMARDLQDAANLTPASSAGMAASAVVQPLDSSLAAMMLSTWEGLQANAMSKACQAFVVITEALNSAGQDAGEPPPAALQLGSSSELARCLDLMVCVTAMTAAQTFSSTGRGGSSSSGRSSAAGVAAAAAGFGFPVSPLSSKLFDLLGVSQATVLLAAKHMQQDGSMSVVSTLEALGEPNLFLLYPWARDPTAPITQANVVHMETGFLLSSLLLQWVDSLPNGPLAATGSGQLVLEHVVHVVATVASYLCISPLHVLSGYRGTAEVVLPAAAAEQLMMLVPAAQVVGDRQQYARLAQSAAARQAAIKRQQHFLLLPPTPVIAELVPVLLRLCRTRLHLLQAPPPPVNHGTSAAGTSTSSAAPSTGPASERADYMIRAANNCQQLLAQLVRASQLPAEVLPSHDAAATGSAAPAAPAVPLLAICTPADLGAYLHSYEVFAAHAVDIIAVQEGEVRCWLRMGGSSEVAANAQMHLQRPLEVALLLACTAGPGSAALRQCYSLCSSLLKLAAHQAWHSTPNSRISLILLVARHAAGWLTQELDMEEQQEQQQQEPQLQQGSLFSASAAASVLPSLVIIGRSFVQVAAQLQAGLPEQQQQQELFEVCFGEQSLASGLAMLAHTASLWLLLRSAQLAAADYPCHAVLQQLAQLEPALQTCRLTRSAGTTAASSHSPSSRQDEMYAAAVQQLRLAGASLSTLPVPCLCNNPGCSNTAGMTELGLVSGRSCVCGGCSVARYCSRACQRAHWSQHKPVCVALAAAGSHG